MQCAMHLPTTSLLVLAATAVLPAQQAGPPRRIGVFFWHDSPNDLATLSGIKKGLQESGMPHELLDRRADSDRQKAATALQELRAANCDLVFALGTQATLLAKEAITEVPIVFAAVSDPVASGIVTDWSGSHGKLCGASNWLGPRNVLDVFRLAVPDLKNLGVLRSEDGGVVSAAELATMRNHLAGGGAPGLLVHEEVTKDAAGIEEAVQRLLARGVDAIWVPIDITIYQNLPAVHRGLGGRPVPLLTTAAAGVRNGAHVGAVVDYTLHGRRAALLAIDVLVRGRDPGTLPIDRMQNTLVTVNLAAARRAKIELPLSLLALADDLLDAEASRDAKPR